MIQTHLLKADEAKNAGYAKFNSRDHLAVDIPNNGCTITCRTSDGKKITFAFCPYEENGVPQCVDIQYHDSGTTVPNGDSQVPAQEVTVWTVGHPVHVSKLSDKEKCTLLTLLIPSKPK